MKFTEWFREPGGEELYWEAGSVAGYIAWPHGWAGPGYINSWWNQMEAAVQKANELHRQGPQSV